ncbi:MAG: cysteine desulfurase family protein [Velocimicrobium sp.]
MELRAYLDNSATTKPFDEVKEIMMRTLEVDFGNPSSLHKKGVEAECYIKEARKIIAQSLKVMEKEIIFTSGGTESNNTALIGTALANKRNGNHIITTRIEHPSVYNPLIYLEEMGFEVTYLNVDKNGQIDLQELLDAVKDTTILVSVMYVNNEIGSILDLETISRIMKEKNRRILFHVDAIQAYGKFRIYPNKMSIDLLSVSAHKIHGPKGIGFLYIKDKTKIKPLLYGGEQQKGMRSGTENVPGIAGLATAVKKIYEDHEKKIKKMYELKQYFVEEVEKIDGSYINGMNGVLLEQTAPHIISVSFSDVRSEVLLHALSEKGICVSAGSACASNHPNISGTLKAIGVKKELLDNTIRVSLSEMTTIEELTITIEALKEILPTLRRYTRH